MLKFILLCFFKTQKESEKINPFNNTFILYHYYHFYDCHHHHQNNQNENFQGHQSVSIYNQSEKTKTYL